MSANQPHSLRLTCVEAFLAVAAYGTYTEAAKWLEADATTVGRRLEELERWLHRILLTKPAPFDLTEDGENFVTVATRVVDLIKETGLIAEIGKTRVQADGTVTIEGHKIATAATLEIGRSLVASRASIDPNYTPPPPVSGKDIDMSLVTFPDPVPRVG